MVPIRVYHHGMLPSLYCTLSPPAIKHFEHAIWMNRLGKYADAIAIFDEHLHSQLDTPVVLIELANLHYSNFRYRTLCELLKPRLARLQRDDPNTLDEPEWRLLALMYCVGANRCRGNMEPSIRELKRTKECLADIPVAEYTELHVQCVWKYVIAYLMARLQTGLDGDLEEYHAIPRPNDPASADAWEGLGDLRRELVGQGRFKEANAVFRTEFNRAPLKGRLILGEAFIKDLERCEHIEDRCYMIAQVRLQLAKGMVELHDLATAEAQLESCSRAIDQWYIDVNLDSAHVIPMRLEVEEVHLGFMADYEERARKAIDLADRMEEACHPNLSRCLDMAAETANKAWSLTGKLEYRAQCLALRERLERVDEEVTGDLCDVAMHAYEVHSIAVHTHVDAQKALEWVDGFLKKYPNFKAPRVMASLYTRKAIFLRVLKDQDGGRAADEEAAKWQKLCGSWKKVNNINNSNVIAPGTGAIGGVAYDSEDDNDDEEGFLHGFSNKYEGIQRTDMIVGKTIEFAMQDVAAARITLEDVALTFNMPHLCSAPALEGLRDESSANQAVPRDGTLTVVDLEKELAALRAQNSEQLFRNTWLPQSEDDTSCNERHDFIRKWLSTPVRGSRDRRLMCLLHFLDARHIMASDAKLRKVCIRDCENLLSLWGTLPRMLKEFISSWQWSWHASIAWNYYTMFLAGGQWTLFDNFGYILEIDKRCDLAIDGYRKINRTTGLANIQRLQAQLCVLLLRRCIIYKHLSAQAERSSLENKALELSIDLIGDLDNCETTMIEMRKMGLKLLAEIDNIYSNNEREASWEDGLEGIEKRRELSRLQMNYTTIRYAIRLWTDGVDEFSEETRIAVWNLTQRYKARLLSLAIGMYRPNPPSLVQRIQSSVEEGPVYQQMLDLQMQIDNADAKDRFFPRLRLDEHRQRMKEYPLLRQLIALREGTPLSLSDFEGITTGLEDDVVLVDWMYLEPFFDRGKLLLLTARKGEIPTLDVLNVDVNAIEEWRKSHLDPSEFTKSSPKLASKLSRSTFNEACGRLVEPLEHRTREGEVLVLCPTDFLTGMPLHALDVEEEALIRRNPCVYIHSHSLLRPCSSAAQYAAETAAPLDPVFLSGIAGIGADAEKFAAGRDSVGKLAERLQGTSLKDKGATKADFLEHATHARLVHVQTHCAWDSENPLDHHIEFETVGENGPVHETLSARDVFALRLRQGSHLNVIACSGALTEVKAGDEVMGLVPALLYSGASSVVSTLWPIYDPVGAQFSKMFFESFVEQQREEGARWVNVAKAVQHGVMSLDPKQNEALDKWAPFVLNGFWMFAL
ncbi:hypothetical protein K491DRAFT_759564 [Lophiostoma macrostomum CBS 122681]|uniref:CHAT domain-containing protein n=1 Tax=Lophiostoma macrostomum CBS 122681 TaxID=1314788 RepID=A0A6A6T1S9_9PLEO|nr:hypothetical protein K491DRAFT_759564 [Lophiostoma macrostomum CBS 122681]